MSEPAAERFAFDTNVLFYSIDTRDSAKHSIASLLVADGDPNRARFLLQSFCELLNAAGRHGAAMQQAAATVIAKASGIYDVFPTVIEDLSNAASLQRQYQIQFFDALLLAVASRAGCSLFLSEDLQDGQTYGTITVRNPSKLKQSELAALLG